MTQLLLNPLKKSYPNFIKVIKENNMNKFTTSIATVLLATLFSTSAFALDSKSVAAVNGKKITQQQYQEFLKQLSTAQAAKGNKQPINRQVVLDELINREILLQEATRLKLHKDKKVMAILKQQKDAVLLQALVSKSPAAKPVSEKELKAFYDKDIKNIDPTEYKTRHIQVKDEATAKKLITTLNDGADFAELATKESKDPSAKNGGDLDWLSAAQMPPAFSKAVAKLKNGMHTQKPVKTKFGYHIIKLEDLRKREIPAFDAVKGQISQVIQQQRFQKYASKLRSKAKIEIK